jgi:hypothetical protein
MELLLTDPQPSLLWLAVKLMELLLIGVCLSLLGLAIAYLAFGAAACAGGRRAAAKRRQEAAAPAHSLAGEASSAEATGFLPRDRPVSPPASRPAAADAAFGLQ